MSKLYSECEKCSGSGIWTPRPEKRPGGGMTLHSPRDCPDCEGIGAIPTTQGVAILDLIQRWRRAGKLR
ncbi:hypothetical protein [Croceibacterium aestuarii]|uniref:hypothetical protein n=1 Tax=Croceibacterium aestuarii TaxID=3064139 RepID=UPI003F6F9D68